MPREEQKTTTQAEVEIAAGTLLQPTDSRDAIPARRHLPKTELDVESS
jgi:hypothetical protein